MKAEWVPRNKEQYHFLKPHFNLVFGEEKYLADNTLFCFTIIEEKTLCAVSVIRYSEEDNSLLLCYTFVEPDYRRKGYNTLIKLEAEKFARQRSLCKMVGHVREQNNASYNSLLKNGFVVEDRGELFYNNGDRKIRMVKYLEY